jgi:amino acid synthesis protein
MELKIRRTFTIVEERQIEAGQKADVPLRKVAAVTVLENPFVGRYVADLAPMIEASRKLGAQMAQQLIAALAPFEAQSYGKGGIVGIAGEQEHANALLTTTFANPVRNALGRGDAWISSMTKVAAPGTLIDIPMNCVDDIYVRSHYDGMSLVLPDAPLADEMAIIFCLANRGRLNARVGGMSYSEARKKAEEKLR